MCGQKKLRSEIKKEDKIILLPFMVLSCFAFLLVPMMANAAPAADPFQGMLGTMTGWVTGSLGKLLAVFALIVAGFHGTHGCLKCALGAMLMAIILAFGPNVISQLFMAAP